MTEPAADVLWVRYLDWCSARVAHRFTQLSESDVWERAERMREATAADASAPSSYFDLVQVLTRDLYDELALPEFAVWAESYRADPAPFDREILGFAEPDRSKQGSAHT
jgi:hypothetical protein